MAALSTQPAQIRRRSPRLVSSGSADLVPVPQRLWANHFACTFTFVAATNRPRNPSSCMDEVVYGLRVGLVTGALHACRG